MNTGLIMILLGGFFGLVGLICLIMGIRSGRRAKQMEYSNTQNMNQMQNQMRPQMNPQMNNQGRKPMNQNMGSDPFGNDNNISNGNIRKPNMVQPNHSNDFDPFANNAPSERVRPQNSGRNNDDFDPFAPEPKPQNDYENEDFDPFVNSPSDVNRGVRPINNSFKMPNLPDFQDEVDDFKNSKFQNLDSNFDAGMGFEDSGDFDVGMGFEEPKDNRKNSFIDMDEDLEDF